MSQYITEQDLSKLYGIPYKIIEKMNFNGSLIYDAMTSQYKKISLLSEEEKENLDYQEMEGEILKIHRRQILSSTYRTFSIRKYKERYPLVYFALLLYLPQAMCRRQPCEYVMHGVV